ncbi:CHAT domain-containing protein [Streptomyces sp. NPDC053542]|uniref:CHAT domain-containing protein n=1 Tax=Streptomyces sp. NPDC053542 TaxID=3365710 RepID=UPI0037D9741B
MKDTRQGCVTVTLRQVRAGQVRLRYEYDDGASPTLAEVSTDEVKGLLNRAETDYYAIPPDDPEQRNRLLEKLGRNLYDFIDHDRCLSAYRERSKGLRDLITLAIRNEAPADVWMDHLPWELLHNGRGFLVAGAPPLVPVRLVGGAAWPTGPKQRALRILFMACAPEDVPARLAYEAEEGAIRAATSRHAGQFRTEVSGNLDRLSNLLHDYAPDHFDVVHISGHARHGTGGPRFLTMGADGKAVEVSSEDLRDTWEFTSPTLIFLSGCRTGEASEVGVVPSLAQALAEGPGPADRDRLGPAGSGRVRRGGDGEVLPVLGPRALTRGLSGAHVPPTAGTRGGTLALASHVRAGQRTAWPPCATEP